MTILAFLLWHKYYTSQTRYVVLLFVSNAIYSFFYAFEISFKTLDEISIFYPLEYFGISFLSTYYLMFALRFTGRDKWLTLFSKVILFIVPVVTLILVFTNDSHHLFYKKEEMNLAGPFPSLSFQPAVWYDVHQGYVILNMIISLIFLTGMLRKAASIYRQQILLLILATIFPFLGYLGYQLGFVPYGIDPVSFTFTITGIVVYLALVRFKLFDLVPIARTKLFEKIQDMVLVFDLNNRLIDFNNSASKHFSITKHDLGKDSAALPGTWPQMMHFTQNQSSGKVEIWNKEHTESNFYNIQILELENSDKIKQGKLIIIKNITTLIIAERERNYATSKLDAVISAMPDIILVINNNGIFTDFFASDTEHLFLKRDEIIGASLNQFFNEEEAVIMKQLIGDCLNSSELITHQFNMNFPGVLMHYEARLSRIDDAHVMAIIRDVTKSVDMKQDLLYQSGFQKILMNLASRFIYIPESETNSVINDALQQIAEYVGVDRSYIFRYDHEHQFVTNTHEWCSQEIEPLILKRQVIPTSLISAWMTNHLNGKHTLVNKIKKHETEDPLSSSLSFPNMKSVLTIPMISQKNCLGFVGFDTINVNKKWNDSDISSLKIFTGMLANLLEKITIEESLAEARIRAEASNRLKTAFMNNISHEIRTPLNGIIGFGEIIANEQLTLDEKNKFLAVVQESSERLIKTIDDYLDISMIVTGNQEIHSKKVNLSKLIESVVNKFSESCHLKNLEILAEIPVNLRLLTLHTDPDLLRKVLNHLAGNAIKFTENGSIKIGIESVGDQITLYVKDTGIGISDNAQKLIFDSFMQEDYSSTRLYEGSGLGLAIVKGIVTLLKGEISLYSAKGEGSIFKITFTV